MNFEENGHFVLKHRGGVYYPTYKTNTFND